MYFKGDCDLAKNEINKLIKQGITDEKLTLLKQHVETINTAKGKANSLFKEGKYDEAINEYTKLIEFDPENKNFISIILTNRALCYKKKGKNMEAMKDADDAIQRMIGSARELKKVCSNSFSFFSCFFLANAND